MVDTYAHLCVPVEASMCTFVRFSCSFAGAGYAPWPEVRLETII